MTENPILRRKIFENDKSKSVLIFTCPFGTKIGLFTKLIKGLVKDGYIVVAYDFNNQVLLSGEPSTLIELINKANEDMGSVIRNYVDIGIANFGFFGTSLGGFVLFNAAAVLPELGWGIFSAGGNIAEGVWKLTSTRRAYVKKGYTLEDLKRSWAKILYPDFTRTEKRRRFLIIGSKYDHVAPFSKLQEFADYITDKSGAAVEVTKQTGYGHNHSGLAGLIKCRRLVRQLDLNA